MSKMERPTNTTNAKEIYLNTSIGAGYFFRTYKELFGSLGWLLEYNGTVNYSFNQQKLISSSPSYPAYNNKASSIGIRLNVLPALYYRISNPLLIEASFGGLGAGYYHSLSRSTESSSFNVGFNFPANFAFGLQFLLGSKK